MKTPKTKIPEPDPTPPPARTPASEAAAATDVERKKDSQRRGVQSTVLAPFLGSGGGRELLG